MTLVVACATQDIAFVVGDTLLSSSYVLKGSNGPVNGMHHTLKVQILNGATVVAFAGDPALATELISDLNQQLANNPNIDSPDYLLERYLQALRCKTKGLEPDCDFLVLQIKSDGRQLAKVTRDGINRCQRAYIGDHTAYKRMTELRKAYLPPVTQHIRQPDGGFREEPLTVSEGEVEFTEISDAMEALCHERTCQSVGSIPNGLTRVVDARASGEFEYMQIGEVSLSPEEGATGYSLLASNSGRRGVALFFRSGCMGFVFPVGDPIGCRKEYADSIGQFVALAKDKFGLHLTGATWPE